MDADEDSIGASPLSSWGSDLNLDGETTLVDYGIWIRDLYFVPGDWLLDLLQHHAPVITDRLALTTATAGGPAAALLSGFSWCAALIALIVALRGLWRVVARIRDMLHSLRIAIVARLHSIARALRRILSWRPWTASEKAAGVPADVAISDADLAVLRTQSRLQPGYVLTPPQIANVTRLRPSQVETILDRLAGLQLVEFVFSSLDGYDGYRLTQAGRMYMTVCEPKPARSA